MDYLVDCSGEIGRYQANVSLWRGDRVVVRSRGSLRLAEVLRPATTRHGAHYPDVAGEVLRTADDSDLANAGEMAQRANLLLSRGGELATSLGLPIELLDAEITLDGSHGSFVYLHWAECDIRELVSPLSQEFDLSLTPNDLTAPTLGGCGNCGSGGCGSGGCGSGGCGSGSCGSPSQDELREYFAGLREKFQRRVPLL